MLHQHVYPFSAIVGQEQLKLALTLNVVNNNERQAVVAPTQAAIWVWTVTG